MKGGWQMNLTVTAIGLLSVAVSTSAIALPQFEPLPPWVGKAQVEHFTRTPPDRLNGARVQRTGQVSPAKDGDIKGSPYAFPDSPNELESPPGFCNDHKSGHFGHHPLIPQDAATMFAGRLAAIETLVGIRNEQLDVWRNYTSALLDFIEGLKPQQESAGLQDNRSATTEGQQLFAERMADHAIELADKAQTLKGAMQSLRQVLSPGQLAKLAETDRPGPDWPGSFDEDGGRRNDIPPGPVGR